MKKIIAILISLSILFCFSACNNTSTGFLNETVNIDIEALKENWTKGEITFGNGNIITLPCTYTKFLEVSGLVVYNSDNYTGTVINPFEAVSLPIADNNTMFDINCANTINPEDESVVIENIILHKSTVVKVTIKDIKEGNRDVKIANSLTVGALREDIETALGVPESVTDDNATYVYTHEKIILTITFNEKNVASEISYEYNYK